MKTIGLIGGTSWHSTIEYYKFINQSVNEHFGNNTNPPLVLYNLNHALVNQYQLEGAWHKIADLIVIGGQRLQDAGAEALVLCANTQHKVYDLVASQLDIPILHIADATARQIQKQGLQSVCFLGTKFSMEADFITERITRHQIKVLVPDRSLVIEELHRIIHQELVYGQVLPKSKNYVLGCINELTAQGAEGVVLGCTEFPHLIQPEDLPFPVFNTTSIHAQAAVDFILDEFEPRP